jgi:hypothetical protein
LIEENEGFKLMDMAHERDSSSSEEEVMAGDLRRGPWTVEEDILLVNYIAAHGEGRWNSLARSAGRIRFMIIHPSAQLHISSPLSRTACLHPLVWSPHA